MPPASPRHEPPCPRRLRVMHMASGGFSGATQVAIDLTAGSAADHEALLVLRRKRRTPMARVAELRQRGLAVECVPGWSHLATVLAVRALCARWQPDVVVGHGFPEHLLARWGGVWATGQPPLLVQVEHNARERYTAFKRWQARRLEPRTSAFVGITAAVRDVLLQQGLPPERCHVIHNGIDLSAYPDEPARWEGRENAILMVARFGAQKDHRTLIDALALLRDQYGLRPQLRLAGAGSARHEREARQQVQAHGLDGQVEFLGFRRDVPQLFQRHRLAVLSTHFEGLGLVLVEAMAAGCAVMATDDPAVREVLAHGQHGRLVEPANAQAWAQALAEALQEGPAELAQSLQRAERARQAVRRDYTRQRMIEDYRALFHRLMETGSR